MNSTPSIPPKSAITVIWVTLTRMAGSSRAQRKSAGRVKMTPAARDSPADPTVCTMLDSRMVPPQMRKMATAITAAGIEALTVSPTRSPR